MKKKKKSCRFKFFMDFEKYRGTEVEKTKSELEALGFDVEIEENFVHGDNFPEKLVVDVKILGNNHVKIIAGAFKFLTSKN